MSAPEDHERVVLVDGADQEIGTWPKLDAHRRGGTLHRAFSVVVYDGRGRVLLQRRAERKYHAPGQWANTCCSHPRPQESVDRAAHRKLQQEMGFDCPLTELFSFTYSAELGGGMAEREFDHVLVGRFDGEPRPNPEEVGEFRWATLAQLFEEVRLDSPSYTPWFKFILVQLAQEPERLPAELRAGLPGR
jgi:isopentenyl-diphosphate Delta-isomerase